MPESEPCVLTNPVTERTLRWDACFNVRDLGGCVTSDGAMTRFGAVVRADSVSRLSERGCAALEEYGIRTVIDLRIPVEVRDDPNPYGEHPTVTIHYLPLDPNDRAVSKAVSAYKEMGLPYMAAVNAAYLGAKQEQIGAILRAIADAEAGGVLIHCVAGRDRTGLIAALLLALASVPAETIIADYILSFSTVAETMEATLGHLEHAHGGIEAYLRAAGVSDEQIARLRARLREE